MPAWVALILGIAVAFYGQNALTKNHLTDPVKIARECKSDLELFCKGLRPGGQRLLSCLKEKGGRIVTHVPCCTQVNRIAEA